MKTKKAAEKNDPHAALDTLLKSDKKQDQIEALNTLGRDANFGFFHELINLTHSSYSEVSQLALQVAVYLAQKYLLDPKMTVGGLRLVWAKLVVEKYCPDFIQKDRKSVV
jgi:hypothetical protein